MTREVTEAKHYFESLLYFSLELTLLSLFRLYLGIKTLLLEAKKPTLFDFMIE